MQSQERPHRIANLNSAPGTLYTLFLPLNHNNGRRIAAQRLGWAQREIMRYAGGLTRLAPSVGFWIGPSAKVYRDTVLPIQTVAHSGPQAEAWFTRLAAEMAIILKQHQIFLFAQPVWLLESVIPQVTPWKGEELNGSNQDHRTVD
jgi:hypothetical protein